VKLYPTYRDNPVCEGLDMHSSTSWSLSRHDSQSMHILHSSVFGFLTNKTGAPQGEVLSRIKPHFSNSSICLVCSCNCATDRGQCQRWHLVGSKSGTDRDSTEFFGSRSSTNLHLKIPTGPDLIEYQIGQISSTDPRTGICNGKCIFGL
jgi:hypothetical protein